MGFNMLNADHVAGMGQNSLEPQRVNNFTLIIGLTGQGISGDARLLQLAIDSFKIPAESNSPIMIPYGNEVRKVAGVAKWENVTCNVKDFVDKDILGSIMSWFNVVYDVRTGIVNHSFVYKRQGLLVAYGPDGRQSRTFNLYGLWPTQVDPGGGDMASNTNNMITMTLRADKCISNL